MRCSQPRGAFPMHGYEVRKRGGHLISDVLPFGRLWYNTPDNATGYAMHSSRSHWMPSSAFMMTPAT